MMVTMILMNYHRQKPDVFHPFKPSAVFVAGQERIAELEAVIERSVSLAEQVRGLSVATVGKSRLNGLHQVHGHGKSPFLMRKT